MDDIFGAHLANDTSALADDPPQAPRASDNTAVNDLVGAAERKQEEASTQEVKRGHPVWKSVVISLLIPAGTIGIFIGLPLLLTGGSSESSNVTQVAKTDVEEPAPAAKAALADDAKTDEEVDMEFDAELDIETVNSDLKALHAWTVNEIHPRMQSTLDRQDALASGLASIKDRNKTLLWWNVALSALVILLLVAIAVSVKRLRESLGQTRLEVHNLRVEPTPARSLEDLG